MERPPRTLEAFRSSTIFITFTIAFAVFTDSFLYAAVVPVMPDSLKAKGFSPDMVQKLILLMLAVFGGSCLLVSVPWGWYSDRHSNRRTPMLIGLMVLLAATGLLWAAPFFTSLPAVIGVSTLARSCQGIASTIVWTTGIAVLVETVGADRIGEFSGYVGLALNAGNFIGPALGGVVHDHGGYHGVLGLCMGIIVVDLFLRLIMIERRGRPILLKGIDPVPDVESIPEKESHVEVKSIQSRSLSSGSTPLTLVPPANKSRVPAVFRLLYSTRFCVNLWGIFILATVFTAFETVLPITVETLFGWTSTEAGLIFLPFSFPSLFGMVIGKLTDRVGGRWFIFTSMVVLSPALISLRFVEQNASADKVLLIVLLLLAGTCQTMSLEPLFAEVARRATELQEHDTQKGRDIGNGYYAQAYSHFSMAWSLGNTVGPIMAGYLNLASGFETTTLALGLLCATSAVPLLLHSDGWLFEGWSEK